MVRGFTHEGFMTSQTYTLMAVHAHPDDESSSTGGLLRCAAEQGQTTIVVTCTNGALGEVKIPDIRLNPRQDPAASWSWLPGRLPTATAARRTAHTPPRPRPARGVPPAPPPARPSARSRVPHTSGPDT